MGTQGVIATVGGLGLYGAIVSPDLEVRLEEVGVEAQGEHLPLDVALGLRAVGSSSRVLLVQAPLRPVLRQIAATHISYELKGRRDEVRAVFDRRSTIPKQPWRVPVVVSNPPSLHFREFSLGEGLLLTGPLHDAIMGFGFDDDTARAALQIRQHMVAEAEDAQGARDGGSNLSVASILMTLLDPGMDGIYTAEVHR